MFQLAIILIALGIGLSTVWVIKSRTKKLPDVSDDLFVEKFNAVFPGVTKEIVLLERKNVAKQLGIPCEKLDPSYTFDKLSNYLNHFGSYDLAIGDLEDEVSELFESRGVEKPYKSPSNIGELIYEIVKAKGEA